MSFFQGQNWKFKSSLMFVAGVGIISPFWFQTEENAAFTISMKWLFLPTLIVFYLLAFRNPESFFGSIINRGSLATLFALIFVTPIYAFMCAAFVFPGYTDMLNAALGSRETINFTGTVSDCYRQSTGRGSRGQMVLNPTSLGREVTFVIPVSEVPLHPNGSQFSAEMKLGKFGFLWK